MKRERRFRKMDSGRYEYAGTGYLVAREASGTWVAYLPGAYSTLWSSPAHASRESAVRAISAERRRIAGLVRAATPR